MASSYYSSSLARSRGANLQPQQDDNGGDIEALLSLPKNKALSDSAKALVAKVDSFQAATSPADTQAQFEAVKPLIRSFANSAADLSEIQRLTLLLKLFRRGGNGGNALLMAMVLSNGGLF